MASANFPNNRLTTTATQIGCSIRSLSGIGFRSRAFAEQLAHHFDKHGSSQGEQASQETERRKFKATQHNIGHQHKQKVATQELHVDHSWHADFLSSGLRSGKARQSANSLL